MHKRDFPFHKPAAKQTKLYNGCATIGQKKLDRLELPPTADTSILGKIS